MHVPNSAVFSASSQWHCCVEGVLKAIKGPPPNQRPRKPNPVTNTGVLGWQQARFRRQLAHNLKERRKGKAQLVAAQDKENRPQKSRPQKSRKRNKDNTAGKKTKKNPASDISDIEAESTMSTASSQEWTNLQEKCRRLDKQVKQKELVIKQKQADNKKLEDEIEEHEKLMEQLNKKYKEERVAHALLKERYKKLLGKKTSTKHEQNEGINGMIREEISQHLFRNYKFARPGEELDALTRKVWTNIKDKNRLEKGDKGRTGLDEEEFVRIYSPSVAHYLSVYRQYVQSRGQEAGHGAVFWHSFAKTWIVCCLGCLSHTLVASIDAFFWHA